MRKRNSSNFLAIIICATAYLACTWYAITISASPNNASNTLTQRNVLMVRGKILEPISPIQSYKHLYTDEKIKLGETLFHDERLDAKKRTTSCATCHNLEIGGTDQLAFSVNSAGKATHFNTPTIYNVSLNSQYYWSGKITSLDDQIDDALKEINTSWPILIRTLKNIPTYVKAFSDQYKDGITKENVKDALIAFESSLLTPDAPFDKYLNGEPESITQNALAGYRLFKSYGCITCHQGKNIGGNVVINLEKLGAPFGKFNSISHRLNGKLLQIRVPSLRNVAVTPPYFHDGSATTLYQAVHRMIDEYAGLEVPENDVYKIVSFLRSLTGYYKGESL